MDEITHINIPGHTITRIPTGRETVYYDIRTTCPSKSLVGYVHEFRGKTDLHIKGVLGYQQMPSVDEALNYARAMLMLGVE